MLKQEFGVLEVSEEVVLDALSNRPYEGLLLLILIAQIVPLFYGLFLQGSNINLYFRELSLKIVNLDLVLLGLFLIIQ